MSSIALDRKFIDQISSQLDRFKWKHNNTAEFRCFECGDSDKSKSKCRGYFYIYDNQYFFKCHNNGISLPFHLILKEFFPEVYSEYCLDGMVNKRPENLAIKLNSDAKKSFLYNSKVESTSVIYLLDDHPAKKYCLGREIPRRKLFKIYYSDDFCAWINKYFPDLNYKRLPTDQRIIFTFADQENKIFGAQGRVINDSDKNRFITIKIDGHKQKLFGLNNINMDKPIFVVEGIIDSLFLPNCLALCGGDVSSVLSELPQDDLYIVLDNEPRSKDTVRRMKRAIDKGFKVCFWDIPSKYKDINQMVLSGYPVRNLLKIIKTSSKSGCAATLELSKWSRI